MSKLATIFAVIIILGAAEATFACSCVPTGPPCQSVSKTDVVFSATVTSISEIKQPTERDMFERRIVKLLVKDVYRGKLTSARTEIRTGLGGGDCGYHFETGKSYLVYASSTDRTTLSTTICSRTRLLSEAAEDLAYFKSLPTANSGGTISGKVQRVTSGASNEEQDKVTPAAGVKITVTGNNKILHAITNAQGRFSLSGLAPGKYKVIADVSHPDKTFREAEVSLVYRNCAEVNFWDRVGVTIEGRVSDSAGVPLFGVKMDLIPVDQADSTTPKSKWSISMGEGKYSFENVPPGKYILGINAVAIPNHRCPQLRSLYGNPDSSQGGFIEVKNEDLKDINIQALARQREITGVVVDRSGTPVSARISLTTETVPYYLLGHPVYTDEAGKFTVNAIEGCSYRLTAVESPQGAIGLIALSGPPPDPTSVVLNITSNNPPLKLVVARKIVVQNHKPDFSIP